MSMPTTQLNSEAQILSRAILPENGDLSPDAASSILDIELSVDDAKRVGELSAKASSGELTDAEQQELDNYLSVGRLLDLMKSKARISLKQQANNS